MKLNILSKRDLIIRGLKRALLFILQLNNSPATCYGNRTQVQAYFTVGQDEAFARQLYLYFGKTTIKTPFRMTSSRPSPSS
jgi:hypothetical protein